MGSTFITFVMDGFGSTHVTGVFMPCIESTCESLVCGLVPWLHRSTELQEDLLQWVQEEGLEGEEFGVEDGAGSLSCSSTSSSSPLSPVPCPSVMSSFGFE